MSAERLDASPALLALMRSKQMPDEQTLRGWETGATATQPASGRRGFASLPFLQSGPFGAARRYLAENQRATRYERRRMRGGDGRLPHSIRHKYTEGQRAALSVIGQEVARKGRCELAVERIATLAGVSVRTVQYAMARAKTLQHLDVTIRRRRGRKALTNFIKVNAMEWAAWLKPKPKRAADRLIGCKGVHATKIKEEKTRREVSELRTEGAYEGEQAADAMPPDRHRRMRHG